MPKNTPIPVSKEQEDFIRNSPTLTIKRKCEHLGLSIWVVTKFMQDNGIPPSRNTQNRKPKSNVMEGYFNVDNYAKKAII